MKKKIIKWVLVDILIVCGAVAFITVCRKTREDCPARQVQITELIRTSQSWDGVELPDYLQDKQVMVLDEFDIHPAKESEVKIVDWDRTYFLTKYYMP